MAELTKLDSITPSTLTKLGFNDPDRALRILRGLPGGGVSDELIDELLPNLFDSLRRSPDPDRALNNFDRWMNAVTSRYTHVQLLLHQPAALDIFFNVCGTSQFFSDILVRNPEYIEILANPRIRGISTSAENMHAELSSFIDAINRPELKLEAIRRFKQREILRIGAADILGLVDMPSTAAEFSNLADACVQKCLEIASGQLRERFGEPPPFAVIAMGKLGGRELNYSSDIDLIFVTSDVEAESEEYKERPDDDVPSAPVAQSLGTVSPTEYANKLAEGLISALSKNLENGHLFRVDVRLRPEGRFGPLVRSLSSYRAYYESWSEPWELQALLKARFIAGDSGLGMSWTSMVAPFVYRRTVPADYLAAIRHNKARIEQKAEVEGVARSNVKVGVGGIRDVEFTVQILQLERGGRHPLLRTQNTLDALARLRQLGMLFRREAEELAEDYIFLRIVEHRLQILYDLQTQLIPQDSSERNLLARRLGFTDVSEFDEEYQRRTRRVRSHFEELFLTGKDVLDRGEIEDLASLVDNAGTTDVDSLLRDRLTEYGFRDPDPILARIREEVSGSGYGEARPDARASFRDLVGPLVSASARTGDPDAAYMAVSILAGDSPNRAELYRALIDGEELLDRICRLGAGSPELIHSLARHPEWLDLLVSDEIIDPNPTSVSAYLEDLESRLSALRLSGKKRVAKPGGPDKSSSSEHNKAKVPNRDQVWTTLATYIQRERLRIGARDLWGDIDSLTVGKELSNLADAVLQSILRWEIETVSKTNPSYSKVLETVAVIGLGKLGGRELGYGSDWDVVFVYSGNPATDLPIINGLCEFLLSAGQDVRSRGAPVEIDARLRPEGRFGALARTVEEYRSYYESSALTWELQSAVKARPVAGNSATARAYMRSVIDVLYHRPFTSTAQDDIIAMKRRIESERLKHDERETDIKLGNGGMSDVEFLVQLHQWRSGQQHPGVRSSNTVDAIAALGSSGVLPAPDAGRLVETYAFLTALRNRLALYGGVSADTLPDDPHRLRAIAVSLGVTGTAAESPESVLRGQLKTRMMETRRIVDRLFYGNR